MPLNEAETRAEHIDPALQAAGWGVVEGSRILREHRITLGRIEGAGHRSPPEIADYVLVYRTHKLAVIEAKRWDLSVTEGLAQAKQYAAKMAVRFAYSTNGQAIYAADMQGEDKERVVEHYPTPDELWQRVFAQQNEWRDRFAAVPYETKGGAWELRYYQQIAVERVLDAITEIRVPHSSRVLCAKGGPGRILLTMATGTGKTDIAFQIAWKLFASRWNLDRTRVPHSSRSSFEREGWAERRPRILFLADRNNLADQAFNKFTAFAAFAEDALVRIAPDDIRKKGRVPKNGNIFFTIFQTFMSGPEVDGKPSPYFGEYPPDFFDFIIIDECHRGGANDESNWRGILEYFSPAAQLGLTATPKRKDNVDTYAYFGDPVYTYSLKDGINDGFLTPFKVRQVSTTLDEYVYTPDDTVVEGEIEEGRRYVESNFNRVIEIAQRESYRVKLLMEMINQREKTLVFCATQEHARAVRDLINQLKTASDPLYCVRVTADDGALGNQYLSDFQDNEKTIPTVLTTSQKLSTGVDARNVRNIVLLRPVNSMIEFKQIIGRGTRLYDGKDFFTIYDFVKAHHHFSDPEWDGDPIEIVSTECKPKIVQEDKPEDIREEEEEEEKPKRTRIKIQLADGKERTLQSMTATSYYHVNGKTMSAAQFLESLYGALPQSLNDEDELRKIWSLPETRKALLSALAEKGYNKEILAEMQRAIEAENSDLFDVLAYVRFALPPVSRESRATSARQLLPAHFGPKQSAFLEFVLAQYVKEGVEELDQENLAPLLKLKYNNAIPDAMTDLGSADQIKNAFIGFQKYLYQETAQR